MRPLPSPRSRNGALPCPRRPITRPATRTRSPLSVPGSRLSKRSRTAATGVRSGNAEGYGSTSPARACATLARRSSRICCSASWDSLTARPVYGAGPRLRGLDAHDLELDGAGRRRHLDDVALLVAEHGLAHRRLVREPVVGGIRFGRPDDLVLVGLPVVHVLDLHLRADRDDVLGDVGGVDHPCPAQLLLQARDAR